jgi:hypothetical protein
MQNRSRHAMGDDQLPQDDSEPSAWIRSNVGCHPRMRELFGDTYQRSIESQILLSPQVEHLRQIYTGESLQLVLGVVAKRARGKAPKRGVAKFTRFMREDFRDHKDSLFALLTNYLNPERAINHEGRIDELLDSVVEYLGRERTRGSFGNTVRFLNRFMDYTADNVHSSSIPTALGVVYVLNHNLDAQSRDSFVTTGLTLRALEGDVINNYRISNFIYITEQLVSNGLADRIIHEVSRDVLHNGVPYDPDFDAREAADDPYLYLQDMLERITLEGESAQLTELRTVMALGRAYANKHPIKEPVKYVPRVYD